MALLTLGARSSCVVGTCPVHHRTLGTTPGPCSPVPVAPSQLVMSVQHVPKHRPVSCRLLKDHCSYRNGGMLFFFFFLTISANLRQKKVFLAYVFLVQSQRTKKLMKSHRGKCIYLHFKLPTLLRKLTLLLPLTLLLWGYYLRNSHAEALSNSSPGARTRTKDRGPC